MTSNSEWLSVESLDLEGQGVAHNSEGKVVFIEGALPGEQVQVSVFRRKNNWEQASISALRRESSQRVTPGCRYFGVCGGCKMQHFQAGAQLATKQRALEDGLWHLAKVKPDQVLRPIEGPAWGYRYRARLSVRYVAKKGKVLVGFHERKSSYVADMGSCDVLPAHLSALLTPLAELIGTLDQRERIPQIEVAVGDDTTALVLRHLEMLSSADQQRLRDFAACHRVQWWLQPHGPSTVHTLDASVASLSYSLPEFGITMRFKPTDFTQVNHQINRVLVARAMRREVLGIEGSEPLVERSRENAAFNGLSATTRFAASNLFEIDAPALAALGHADKWLVDPPREGAFALAKALADVAENPAAAPGYRLPRRIVYVSCNPATLARDAGLLVHQAGYVLSAAGAVNMFPHTAHVESIAVFDREG
jgi:23S rRNA (uracil1939-C5)-methyltransferase